LLTMFRERIAASLWQNATMFSRFIISTIGIGLAVGLLMPVAQPSSQPPTAAKPVASAKAPSPPPTVGVATAGRIIERAADGHFYVEAEVNGRPVRFLVDTGASAVVLTMADAQRVGLPFAVNDFAVIARGASGDVRGQRLRIGSVAIGDQKAFDVDGAVVAEGLDISLLGQSFLTHLGSVVIDRDRMTLQ
jgi:aspartyl protease family protein